MLNPFRRRSRPPLDQLASDIDEVMEQNASLTRSIPPMPLLEREHARCDDNLRRLEDQRVQLEHEIEERQEKLRQTKVAIHAEEAKVSILEAGKEPLSGDPAVCLTDLREIARKHTEESVRLVPRGRPEKSIVMEHQNINSGANGGGAA